MFRFYFISLWVVLFAGSSSAFAETKTLTAEAAYIMGDGETPSFAEAMALQKAKQAALEEAGTYVESYTRSLNQDLTKDEIQTLAGGVVQVEVLEKTRTLVGDGLRVYTKIQATVTTDKMEELARRIKGKNVTQEYVTLQAEYAKLSRELEGWKQKAVRAPKGPERDTAIDRIQEEAKAFARVQQREGEFFQRLVSGQELVQAATRDKEVIDDLLKTIEDHGFLVRVGEAKAVVLRGKTDVLGLNIPLTIRISESLDKAVAQAVRALDGVIRPDVNVWLPDGLQYGLYGLRIGPDTRYRAKLTLVRLGKYRDTAEYFQERVRRLTFLVTFDGTGKSGTTEPFRCLLGGPQEEESDFSRWLYGEWEAHWFPLRRIFPVAQLWPDRPGGFKDNGERITNGEYEKSLSSNRAKQDSPDRDGYVAIVHDEATFVAQVKLDANIVKDLTQVSVRVLSSDAQIKRHRNELRCIVAQ